MMRQDKRRRRQSRIRTSTRKRFFLFVEGPTERLYFKLLGAQKRVSVKVEREGIGLRDMIRLASKLSRDKQRFERGYDEIWIVHDRDKLSDEVVNKYHAQASTLGIQIAYSIPSFEYWLTLHFSNEEASSSAPLTQSDCENRLTNALSQKYRKGNSSQLLRILEHDTRYTVTTATRIVAAVQTLSEDGNPSTSVHLLVDAILEESSNQNK